MFFAYNFFDQFEINFSLESPTVILKQIITNEK